MTKKQLKGKIKSVSGAKTVVVEVARFYHHPLYRKRLQAAKRYLAHAEIDIFPGQEVTIEETRPLSARKRWKVVAVEGKKVVSGGSLVIIGKQKEQAKKQRITRRKKK